MRLAAYIAVLSLLTWTVVLGIQSVKIYNIYGRVLLLETQCTPYPKLPQRPSSSSV